MRVLMINKTDSVGGAAQVMSNLAGGLRDRGHQVKFLVRRKFTSDPNVSELSDHPFTGFLRRLSGRDVPIVLSHWRDLLLGNDIDQGFGSEIINHPLVKWADIIHCHNLHGNYFMLENLAALSKDKSLIWTWHDWWPVTGHCATPQICGQNCYSLKNNIWKKKRNIYRRSRLIAVVPSLDMKNRMSVPGLPLHLVHNGVFRADLVKVSKSELKKTLNLPRDKKIVMYFSYSRLNTAKGWNFIEKLKSQTPQYFWLDIRSRGYLSQPVLQSYMKAADVFLFPSLAESFGMTPVEAMSQGTSVVAFPVGVIPELISHKKTGYIAKYADEVDLLTGLNYVLNHTLAKMSPKTISDYSISEMTDKYLKIYNSDHVKKH